MYDGLQVAADPADIKGIAKVWMPDGKKKLCVLIEVPDDIGAPIMKDFEQKKSENHRKNRCKIISPKTGKVITCPSCNKCTGCKNAGNLKKENSGTLSIDWMSENGNEPSETPNMLLGLELEEFFTRLSDDNALTAMKIISVRYNNPKIKDQDVWKAAGIGKTKFYETVKEIAKLGLEYIDF